MPFVIGLTGGIASGKSTVSKLFADAGVPIIDADIISHQLCEPGQPGYDAIVATFGSAVVDAQGKLNRAYLRQRIFSDAAAKTTLENILHPLIRQRLVKDIEASTSNLLMLAVPLLFEANMQSLADRILVVDCDPAQQLKRLCERDNIDAELAKAMLSAQIDPELRLQSADDIIDNNNGYDALRTQVKHLFSFYQSLASQRKTPSDD